MTHQILKGAKLSTMKFDADLSVHRKFGLVAFFLLFGFGGIWATTAPIEGAAIAPGQVTVKTYSKVVQHLEGGIIKIFLSRMARLWRQMSRFLRSTILNRQLN